MTDDRLQPPAADIGWLATEEIRSGPSAGRILLIMGMALVAGLGLVATAGAFAAPSDSGTQVQLDRIDSNAYAACLNAAGTNATRLARCQAPPTAAPTTAPPPTITAPPTTTPPPTTTSPPPAGFPTAATTGVPAGTALTSTAGLTVSTAGATVDARDISGDLVVNTNNVTVTRTRIRGVVRNCEGCTGLTLTDSEIGDPSRYQVGNFPPITGSYTLLRVHVHRWQDGPRADHGTVLIQDSLVDDLAFATGEHPDAVQQFCPGCTVHVRILHDTLSGCAGNSTDKGNSALFWSDHPGPSSTLELASSLLSCGQFTIRINDTGTGSGNFGNVVADVHDNTVTAGSWAFGPAECGNASAFDGTAGVKWANNVLTTGQTIPSPCA